MAPAVEGKVSQVTERAFSVEQTFELDVPIRDAEYELCVADLLNDLAEHDPSVGIRGTTVVVRITVRGADVDDARAYGVQVIDKALDAAGFTSPLTWPHRRTVGLEVLDSEVLARELATPAETYLGVSEVAALLNVSRQRVSELRTSAAFPAPIAELKAGPVWAASSLRRFTETWERRPGRPARRRATTT